MNLRRLREEQCRLLTQRLDALARIRSGIRYTYGHLLFPLRTTQGLDDATLEALAAFNERFGKFQDILAAAMKQAVQIAGMDTDTFAKVLSSMSKQGIVDDISGWQNLRLLRNIGAHEYDTDPVRQAEYLTTLAEALPTLESIADRLCEYCRRELDCPSQGASIDR